MVEEGVILEIKNNHFIVMDQQGNFVKLKYKRGSYVGQKIFFTDEDIMKKRQYGKLSSYAAILVLLLIPAFILTNFTPSHAAAVIGVDINPSMEFIIDKDEKVIEMRPLNKEAEPLINPEWEGKPYSEILLNYLDIAQAQGYIIDGSVVMFSCTLLKEDINSARIQHLTEDTLLQIESNISYIYSEENEEILKKARKEKLSTGKYKLYQELQKVHPELKKDELKNKKIEDLIPNTGNFKLKQSGNNKEKKEHPDRKDKNESNNRGGNSQHKKQNEKSQPQNANKDQERSVEKNNKGLKNKEQNGIEKMKIKTQSH